MSLVQEFKEFALRGNVIDMAVGFTVGAAFTTVVKSFVDNIMMPPIGALTGGVDFSDKKIRIQDAAEADEGVEAAEAVYLTYGEFINSCISFAIVALAVFIIVKMVNQAQKAVMEEGKPETEEEAKVPEDVQLLREIRDSLQNRPAV